MGLRSFTGKQPAQLPQKRPGVPVVIGNDGWIFPFVGMQTDTSCLIIVFPYIRGESGQIITKHSGHLFLKFTGVSIGGLFCAKIGGQNVHKPEREFVHFPISRKNSKKCTGFRK